MSTSHKFYVWWSRWWVLILLILLGVYLWALDGRLEKTQQFVMHNLGTSTQDADVLWSVQNMFPLMVVDASGVVYAVPLARDELAAIDMNNGAILWHVELPNRGGESGLFVDQDTVFVVTAISVDAYEAKTGSRKWSTELGTGHVSIFSQLDSDVLRVYYGNQLYEVDTKTGKILSQMPKDTIFWVSDNIVLQTLSANQLTAFDRQSGKQLWAAGPLFYIEESQEPQAIGEDILIVTEASGPGWSWSRGICALDLLTGKYNWCRREIYISRIAIDHQVGYVVRSDFVLVTIDLQTGDILGETSFLTDGQPQEHPSFTSTAASNGVVIVSFGDSTQTFALKLR